jgi:hypothetical protein
MSREAIAAGGGIVSGGLVATAQSIGAKGLSLSSTRVLMLGTKLLLNGSVSKVAPLLMILDELVSKSTIFLLTMAAPYIVTDIVHALGFGRGGIVAGSFAAKLMSIFATANGGGIVKGGLVAFLQSVGAAGLSSLGTATSMLIVVALLSGCFLNNNS